MLQQIIMLSDINARDVRTVLALQNFRPRPAPSSSWFNDTSCVLLASMALLACVFEHSMLA